MANNSNRHILEESLSDGEKAQLRSFNANPMMVEAVRKVILFPIWAAGTFKKGEKHTLDNFTLAWIFSNMDKEDAVVGKDIKVRAMAVKLVETAFMEIEGFQSFLEEEKTGNPAR
jgi:hypothetical protein